MTTKKQTIVYVDGLNLYHQLEKTHPHLMWLDVLHLAEIMLGEQNTISQVKYYAARFKPSKKATLQNIYLSALDSQWPRTKFYKGDFKTKTKQVKLANTKARGLPKFADAIISEEKRTDVNLATHLVRDAFCEQFEVAVILTNDTDFVEAIRIVTKEAQLPVGILSPCQLIPRRSQRKTESQKGLPSKRMWIHDDLREVATFYKHIRESHLKNAQFPRVITTRDNEHIIRPPEWD